MTMMNAQQQLHQEDNDMMKHEETPAGAMYFVDSGSAVIVHDEFYFADTDDANNNNKSENADDVMVVETAGDWAHSDDCIPFAHATIQPQDEDDSNDKDEEDAIGDDDDDSAPHDQTHESTLTMAQPVPEPTSGQSTLLRPEFLYVHAIKPTPDSPVGLSFRKMRDGDVYISKIHQGGMFDDNSNNNKATTTTSSSRGGQVCGLHVGDKVLAINNVDCETASLDEILRLIRASPSTISLCVHNQGGDPHSVWSSVQKPTRSSKLGVCFQTRRGALTISTVYPHSLFAQSLLMPNHRCFWINGEYCDHKASQEAADLTAAADRVTIVSRARGAGDLAAVLSIDAAAAMTTGHDCEHGRRRKFLWKLIKRAIFRKNNNNNKNKMHHHSRYCQQTGGVVATADAARIHPSR